MELGHKNLMNLIPKIGEYYEKQVLSVCTNYHEITQKIRKHIFRKIDSIPEQ